MSIEEEKSNDDIFTEAFDRLAETGEAPAPVTATAPETVAAETSAVDDGSEVPAADQGAGEAGNNPDEPVVADAGDGDAKAEAPAPKEPQKAPAEQDIIDRLAQAVKERVQPVQVPQEPQYQQTYEPQPVLTQEDYKTLESFDKDWPDVSKAINLILKEQTNAVVNHVFREFAQEFRPVAQRVMQMQQERHVEQLHTRVNDYDDVRDKVIDWAMQQPPYLRAAYGHVIQNGTAEEVADLIERYRAANAPPPSAPVAPAPPQQRTLSPQVRKAAAALAPVQSKRSTVVRTDDPSDFEGAFSRFADMM